MSEEMYPVADPVTDGTGPDEADNEYAVKLSKPYEFEGSTFTEVDLSGLEKLTTRDMLAADKHLSRGGNISVMPELTLDYALFLAARAAELPIEFFMGLSPRDAVKIKNRVTNFLYGAE